MIYCIVANILKKIDVSVMAALICIFTPIAQGRPEDNQVEFLQGPHGIVNPPKNLVLNNIRRFNMEHGKCTMLSFLAVGPNTYYVIQVVTCQVHRSSLCG